MITSAEVNFKENYSKLEAYLGHWQTLITELFVEVVVG